MKYITMKYKKSLERFS